jgi:hypothetical protein
LLRFSNIGDDGATALGAALAQNSSLTTLALHQNNVGDVGARALGAALAHNSSLTRLELSSNNIGDVGAQTLADSFEPISHSDLPAPQKCSMSLSVDHESSSFSVLVNVLNGDVLSIECSSHESVRSVKRKLCEINPAFSSYRSQLVFERPVGAAAENESELALSASSSVTLSDALSLSDYHIVADDTLHLLLLPRKVCQKYQHTSWIIQYSSCRLLWFSFCFGVLDFRTCLFKSWICKKTVLAKRILTYFSAFVIATKLVLRSLMLIVIEFLLLQMICTICQRKQTRSTIMLYKRIRSFIQYKLHLFPIGPLHQLNFTHLFVFIRSHFSMMPPQVRPVVLETQLLNLLRIPVMNHHGMWREFAVSH